MAIRSITSSRIRFWLMAACFLLLFMVIIKVQQTIQYHVFIKDRIEQASYKEEKMRQMLFKGDYLYKLDQYCKKTGRDFIQELTIRAILFDYELNDSDKEIFYPINQKFKTEIEELSFYTKVVQIYQSIFMDVRYFPVPKDLLGMETVGFQNGFGDARSYGGNRKHEGIDLIPSIKERGYFPIVSVSDGVVANVGWLELGGWRVGIDSDNGGYFYYAHLDSYAPGLKEGDRVSAGQLLGFMGDSGYGKKEGTRGKFIVHLHFGIYVTINNKQVSFNPYPVLNYLLHRRLGYQL